MVTAKQFDVCIVGSGMAGTMLASRLAELGLDILVVEAGKRFDRAQRMAQLRHRQILRTPLWPWEHDLRDVYTDSSINEIGSPYRLNQSRIKAVGGTALHWGGLINRLRESDFETWTTYGVGIDWPISYSDLEPYYGQAEWIIGVAGTQNPGDPPRSKPLPMPAFPPKVGEKPWFDVAERMGFRIGMPGHARNSEPYDSRPPCSAFSVCNICPIGARYSPDFHMDRLTESGRVTLLAETVVRRLEIGGGREIAAIHATDLDGMEHEIRAKTYVVAAHAVESARLLLLSNVGNSSDQVGRNLMEHWYTGAGGFVDSRVFPERIGFETLETNHWYDGPERRDRGAIKLSFRNEYEPLRDGLDKGLLGEELAAWDRERFGHWVGVAAEIEHLPNPDSRVTLSETETDLFGDPAPHIHFALSDFDRATHARARELAAMLSEARGCRDIEPLPGYIRAHHHMGTCRMSVSPEDGVVDRNCQVHDVANLYVLGSSVFPTGGARQPTLTIAALALRLGDHLAGLKPV